MTKYPDRRIAKGSILYEASEEHRRVIAWEIADIYIEDRVKCSPEVVVWCTTLVSDMRR